MRHVYWYDPELGKVVEISGERPRRTTTLTSQVGPQIMPDIKPYKAVGIDNRVVTSRSEHRTMLKDHGMIEVGNEAPSWLRDRLEEDRHG